MTERVYLEYRLDDNVLLVLDHRVVEIFDAAETVASGGHSRWHVDHLGVDAKPAKGGMKITVGLRMPNGDIRYTGGRVMFTVSDEQLPHVLAFFERAKAARTLACEGVLLGHSYVAARSTRATCACTHAAVKDSVRNSQR